MATEMKATMMMRRIRKMARTREVTRRRMAKRRQTTTTVFVCQPQAPSFTLAAPIKPSISHQTHATTMPSCTPLMQYALTPVIGSPPTFHHLMKCATTSIDMHTAFMRLQGAWWSPMHHGYLGHERLISDIEAFVKLASSGDFCI